MNAYSRRRTVLRAAMMLFVPLLIAASPNGAVLAEDKPVAAIKKDEIYGEFVAEAAQRFELPAVWIRAVMHTESDGDPHALSPRGAIGLMQIMPETWDAIRVRHRLGNDPYDPHDNIIAGTAYIRELYDRYGSPGWIAAYNAGPSRYEASLKGHQLPAETRAYVAAVAPNLDGIGIADNITIAPSDAPLWTRAPLFLAPSEGTPSTNPTPNERQSTDTPAIAAVRDVSAIVPQSDGLFVARAGTGRQP